MADYLKEQLDTYMSQFPKVRIIRLKERQGLIRARLTGAAVAKGNHCCAFVINIINVWFASLRDYVPRKRKRKAGVTCMCQIMWSDFVIGPLKTQG